MSKRNFVGKILTVLFLSAFFIMQFHFSVYGTGDGGNNGGGCNETGSAEWGEWSQKSAGSVTDESVSGESEIVVAIGGGVPKPTINGSISPGVKKQTNTLVCPESSGYGQENTEDDPYDPAIKFWAEGWPAGFTTAGTFTYTAKVKGEGASVCDDVPAKTAGSVTVKVVETASVSASPTLVCAGGYYTDGAVVTAMSNPSDTDMEELEWQKKVKPAEGEWGSWSGLTIMSDNFTAVSDVVEDEKYRARNGVHDSWKVSDTVSFVGPGEWGQDGPQITVGIPEVIENKINDLIQACGLGVSISDPSFSYKEKSRDCCLDNSIITGGETESEGAISGKIKTSEEMPIPNCSLPTVEITRSYMGKEYSIKLKVGCFWEWDVSVGGSGGRRKSECADYDCLYGSVGGGMAVSAKGKIEALACFGPDEEDCMGIVFNAITVSTSVNATIDYNKDGCDGNVTSSGSVGTIGLTSSFKASGIPITFSYTKNFNGFDIW